MKDPSGRVAQAGAIAVQRTPDVRVLLVRAKNARREWIFPKGHVEPGETSAEAAVRELREEAGVVGRVVSLVGQSEFMSNDESVSVDYYLIEPLSTVEDHEPREQRWCSVDEALFLLPFPDARGLLERAARSL